jgi:histidinol dehydrogenase
VPATLSRSDADFERRFSALLAAKREVSEDVDAAVRTIVEDVRQRGDHALIEYTAKFDGVALTPDRLRFTRNEIAAAEKAIGSSERDALLFARDRIEAFHRRQLPSDDRYTDDTGVELGLRWTAIDSVGLYVPGGLAAYPSSVLMNAVPARVAGVERIVMVTPTPGGKVNPLVLAAARIAGVSEIYCIGGAQAIAALAYGTDTVKPVAKIMGPGNAWVAAAKRQVFGQVGIDMIAGPSEVLVVADGDNDPDWIAADLLAQAEHDPSAQSILLTDSASLANRIAPEHLELAVADPEALLPKVRNAGAIFLGRHTPEVVGDYVGGPNHVLPTARSARFSSGLSVFDFLKRTSLLKLGPDQLRALAPAAITLAEAEGLDAHARSVAIRLNRPRS